MLVNFIYAIVNGEVVTRPAVIVSSAVTRDSDGEEFSCYNLLVFHDPGDSESPPLVEPKLNVTTGGSVGQFSW